ncbi:MAG: endolytic transglycosylase MltG [Lachnospiraceae bacterium]|nr:endolytic transglycosylase MltG [Lachnospiraceae bacterium]
MNKKLAVTIGMTALKIAVVIGIVLAMYHLCFAAYDVGYRIFAEEAIDPGAGISVSVSIVDGKTPREIGEILEEKGLIRSGTLFVFQEMFSEYHDELQPGVYELNTGMTPFEMMEIMAGQVETEEE